MNKPQTWTRRSLFPLAALALGGAPGCDSAAGPAAPTVARSNKLRAVPNVPAEDRAAAAAGQRTFAVDLYRRVAAQATDNVVVSPASITTALAMALAGARGDTEAEMLAGLRQPLAQARLHPAMNEVDAALHARGAGKKGADGGPFRLRIVNTAWMQKEATFLPAYLDALAEHYGAGVDLVDFAGAPESARLAINERVARDTEQKIEDLLAKGLISSATRLVLTNAIYFNAAWRSPFTRSREAPFTRPGGTAVPVPVMGLDGGLRAARGEGWHAVELPYEDERLSMLIVVPDAGTFPAFDGALDGARLDAIVDALASRTVNLTLPRFRFELPVDLGAHLGDMGMKAPFEPGRADFSGMTGARDLFISAVVHKAFIAVGEKGTEAAAATAVVIGVTSAPANPLNLVVDRPFLFFVRDEPTGAILFMGRVTDPSKTSGG